MEINIADDYFREQKKNELLQEDMQTKDKDLYDLKHDLITTQMKLENTEKTMRSLRQESEERAKRIIQLEAELKSLGR